MTTIVSPASSPVPVYNRSGVTIVEVPATGQDQSTGAPIPAVSGHTVVLGSTSGLTDRCVNLPSGSDIGDVIEVYNVAATNGGYALVVNPASGETLNSGSDGLPCSLVGGRWFRKTSSTNWQSFGNIS